MARSLRSTLRFFGHVARDLAGTFWTRWQRFHRRLAEGESELVVGVDVFPFTEAKTGVGWYEWSLLEALDRRADGLVFNLYAHTFLAPEEPQAPDTPGRRRQRLRAHHLPADLAFAAMPETVAPDTLRLLRTHLPATLFRADRLIAVSDATAGELVGRLAANRRRIHTIHEGLDPLELRLRPPCLQPQTKTTRLPHPLCNRLLRKTSRFALPRIPLDKSVPPVHPAPPHLDPPPKPWGGPCLRGGS